MLRLFIVVLLLFSGMAQAQNRSVPIYIEHNSLLDNSEQIELLSYKIPFKNLLFVKANSVYTASFTLTFEFYMEDEFVSREILNPSFTSDNYDKTLSDNEYYQDLLTVKLQPGEYRLNSTLSLGATDIEYNIPQQTIIIDTLSKLKLLEPIVVYNKSWSNINNNFVLANFGNKIPFAPQKYDLLIGIVDSSINTAEVSINQFDKEIVTNSIKSFSNGNIEFIKGKENILVSFADSSNLNYFHISDFSHMLNEGPAELIVKYDTNEIKYSLITTWIDKPEILNNPEYSIKLLEYIEEENLIGKLLSSEEENYYKNLSKYWIDNYPANGMKFNYAMKEYYSRADYAIKNLSSLNSLDGAERDRGRIYITYGPPTSIDRNYSEINEIIEVWKYEKIGRTFLFKDTNGTGKFDLNE